MHCCNLCTRCSDVGQLLPGLGEPQVRATTASATKYHPESISTTPQQVLLCQLLSGAIELGAIETKMRATTTLLTTAPSRSLPITKFARLV